MSKKKTRASQSGPVWHRSAEEATLDKMPKYNAHICKTGPHGSAKYDRAKAKRDWQREMSQGIARTRGRFPFLGAHGFRVVPKGTVPFGTILRRARHVAVRSSCRHAIASWIGVPRSARTSIFDALRQKIAKVWGFSLRNLAPKTSGFLFSQFRVEP